MDISNRLNEAMRGAGFGDNQSELARASGVPQSTINRILKGGMSRGPESGTLRKLAAACGVNMLWLLEGVGPKRNGEPQSGNVHQLQPIGPTSKTNPLDPPTVLNADEMIELMALYQQSTDRGRRFIMESARVADKRPGAARWILAVNDNA